MKKMSSNLDFNSGCKSIKEILNQGINYLDKAGIEDSRHNANLIAAKVLNLDYRKLPFHWQETATSKFCETFLEHIVRRSKNEPLQYILGEWSFLDLEVCVEPGALIPRPETEEVFLAAEEAINKHKLPLNFRFADIGTGTGILGLAMLSRFPEAHGELVDISDEALAIAEKNTKRYPELAPKLKLIKSNLLEAFLPNSLDVIISNPPYIDRDEIKSLMPEVLEHEPKLALDGGSQGLEIIKDLIEQSEIKLKNSGLLIFEHGHGQRSKIRNLLSNKWKILKKGDDFAGKERYFILQLL